jgi:hypothetical protein
MAVFTTITKQKLNWVAPATVASGAPEVDFLFSDASDFLFSDGTDYVFRESLSERVSTEWSNINKRA